MGNIGFLGILQILLFQKTRKVLSLFITQGVMRVRKRVTLMAITVSVIFEICWGTKVVVYVIKYVASYNIGPIPVTIANTMVLFNSAVNPFVYALLNQQFREKMKKIICCAGSSAPMVPLAKEPPRVELVNVTTQPPQASGPCYQGCNNHFL